MDRAAALLDVLESNAGVDLHSHTVHSDGHWTPGALVQDAVRLGIRVLGMTDHDTVGGLQEGLEAADEAGLVLLPGIEVTLAYRHHAYHLLCYAIDVHDPVWGAVTAYRQRAEQRYYRAVLEELRGRGYPVQDHTVQDRRGRYVAHPITGALQAAGSARNFEQARELLSSLHLVYPYELLAMQAHEFAEMLPVGAALCVIAHAGREQPGVSNRLTDTDLSGLRRLLPLAGLEAYHPYHSPAEVSGCVGLAEAHGLTLTAGSDAHGWQVGRPPRPHPAALSRRFLEMVRERLAGPVVAGADRQTEHSRA